MSSNPQSYELVVPQIDGNTCTIKMSIGDVLFILGSNGTGKSSLMQYLNRNQQNVTWISSLRQTFFQDGPQVLRYKDKEDIEKNIHASEKRARSRWHDDHVAVKPGITITNLVSAIHAQNQEVTDLLYDKQAPAAEQYVQTNTRILDKINRLLQQANLQISLKLKKEELLAQKNSSKEYNAAALSDGERSVLLIASQVLTASPGTVILIDEPERHLHPSIITPLLKSLFAERSDCVFVVSTHEVRLPTDTPSAKTLLVRGCTYGQTEAEKWDTDLLEDYGEIDDEIKKDILGPRRKLLFVEGTDDSLDKPIYSLLLPNVTIIPMQSCRNVENTVKSIRKTAQLNYIDAYGIVDRDSRENEEIEQLRMDGIYSLPTHAVESLYYNKEVRKAVGEERAELTGDSQNIQEWLVNAEDEALRAIKNDSDRICLQRIEHKMRRLFFKQLSNKIKIKESVCIDTANVLQCESEKLNKYIEKHDLDTIIAQYPIKKSNVRSCLAKGIKYNDYNEYERTVIQLLKNNSQLLEHVKSLLGSLPDDINK